MVVVSSGCLPLKLIQTRLATYVRRDKLCIAHYIALHRWVWFFCAEGLQRRWRSQQRGLHCCSVLLRRNSRPSFLLVHIFLETGVDYRYIASYAFPFRLRTIHGGVVAFGVYPSSFLLHQRQKRGAQGVSLSGSTTTNMLACMFSSIHIYSPTNNTTKHHSSSFSSASSKSKSSFHFSWRECIVNIKTSSCQQYA